MHYLLITGMFFNGKCDNNLKIRKLSHVSKSSTVPCSPIDELCFWSRSLCCWWRGSFIDRNSPTTWGGSGISITLSEFASSCGKQEYQMQLSAGSVGGSQLLTPERPPHTHTRALLHNCDHKRLVTACGMKPQWYCIRLLLYLFGDVSVVRV